MQRFRQRNGFGQFVIPAILVVVSVGLAGWVIYLASKGPLTSLEQGLFQVLSLAAGLTGSYWWGSKAAAGASPPSARSAVRRVLGLYAGLGRTLAVIDDRGDRLRQLSQGGSVGNTHAEDALALIRAQVSEQLSTANDSVEDWKDLLGAEEADKLVREAADAAARVAAPVIIMSGGA